VLLLLSLGLYGDRVLAGYFCRPLDPGDLVFLEEELDALGVLGAHRAGAFHGDAVIELHITDGDAEIGGVRHFCRDRCCFEQRFGGNAAPQDAGAAQAFALDDGDRHSELSAADRADIPGRSPAYEDHVVRSHFLFSSSWA